MPKPRKALVSLEATPYYHCVSRCVRRAFLCGKDNHTGQSFEHRRAWIEARMLFLSQLFALDLCAYAVMSNHYHVVLHVDRQRAENWDDLEIIARWHRLFSGHALTQRLLSGDSLLNSEQKLVNSLVALWRRRLMDISWFMRCLNEPIARQANREDDCTGRFWEGRFTSQALLDEKALAACLAYVDLNPVRAGVAETPELCEHTSMRKRIKAAQAKDGSRQPSGLMPFAGAAGEGVSPKLPFHFRDYLELLDWTGRALRHDRRGVIPAGQPPILERLRIAPRYWLYMTKNFESRFKGLVGTAMALRAACESLGYRRTPGLAACYELMG